MVADKKSAKNKESKKSPKIEEEVPSKPVEEAKEI
jgi:hypothetical protein